MNGQVYLYNIIKEFICQQNFQTFSIFFTYLAITRFRPVNYIEKALVMTKGDQ